MAIPALGEARRRVGPLTQVRDLTFHGLFHDARPPLLGVVHGERRSPKMLIGPEGAHGIKVSIFGRLERLW